MKQVRKIAIALVLLVATAGSVNAQDKIAYIDVTQLLSAMPETKAAEAELKKLQETYGADIEGSMTELRNKYTQYESEAGSKTKEENDKRAQELQEFQKNIGEAQQKAQQEMQKKQNELFTPISNKAKAAIEKVAAANNIVYVLDSQPGSTLIVAKGLDLLPLVKKELGI